MWQRDWDQWRIENFPDARPAEYLSKKLVTNFTEEIYEELLEYENQFISKLNSKPKCSEPQQKSEQNNNKTESNQPKILNIRRTNIILEVAGIDPNRLETVETLLIWLGFEV